jgi:hypothetical protein
VIKLKGKEAIRKYWYILLSALAIVSLVTYVFAFNLSWSAPVSIVTTSTNIQVYSDSACTNLVTSINFGNIQQGGYALSPELYIKNVAGGAVRVYWNSTLRFVTTKIQECWVETTGWQNSPWNGTTLSSGGYIATWYQIKVDPTIPLSSYSWTLYVGSWGA